MADQAHLAVASSTEDGESRYHLQEELNGVNRLYTSNQPTVNSNDSTAVNNNTAYNHSNSSGNRNSNSSSSNNNNNNNNNRNNQNRNTDYGDEENENEAMSLTELLYSSSSYYAIVKPVTLTMILAALAVMCINNEETRMQSQSQMTEAFTVWNSDPSSNAGSKIGVSLANAIVLVGGICAVTFVIVVLYWFRCMWLLMGYMIFASATLLGVLGGTMFEVYIEVYELIVDRLSFYWFIYNFAVVGVMAVFWGQGFPKFISKGYLVATSVILAWQLANFDELTTWCLLIMLALYDLCAVLTPCGPLRALVNLMSKADSPEMPGLLYEAELPAEARRPGVPHRSRSKPSTAPTSDLGSMRSHVSPNDPDYVADDRSSLAEDSDAGTSLSSLSDVGPLVQVPLAIAQVYNLPVVSIPNQGEGVNEAPLLAGDLPENPTPKQLCTEVTVQLPSTGGRIERTNRAKMFLERDRFGKPKRTLWVDRKGKVYSQELETDDDGDDSNTIRLGLGDFIFYSVLVAKAAQHGFATFLACMLVILTGLGGTLILLAVYHHALPALPFSIFLGVIFYALTRALIEPWIEAIFSRPIYV